MNSKIKKIEKSYKSELPKILLEILNKTNCISSTADLLGVSRNTVYSYIKKYNISKGKYRWVKVG